jgi:protein-S-isoprenylcysteine O-methyltransferase Ste14
LTVSKYVDWAQRLRVPLGFALGALYLVTARPTAISLAAGASIALVGLLLRAWAAGHIVKNDRLATTGPYAHTRNPLYLGSFLIAAGFALAAHWTLLVVVVAFFAVVYAPVLERERQQIRARFPDAYAEYERNVPAFVPRPLPWRSAARGEQGFSLELYMRHAEWRAALGYVAVLLWLVARVRGGP